MWSRSCAKKHLSRILHPLTVLVANLDGWFVKFKVTASEGKAPGQGRLNPTNGQTLSKPETKAAAKEAKKKAQLVLDVLSLEEICQPVEAPTRAKCSLPLVASLQEGDRIKARVISCQPSNVWQCWHGDWAHQCNKSC